MMMSDVEGGENPGRASKTAGSQHKHRKTKKNGADIFSRKKIGVSNVKKMSLDTIRF